MSSTLLERRAAAGPAVGAIHARRAVVRWAWRLLRREWRQQLLVLALIVVAVAATVVGSTVATDNPPPANSGFGTAQDMATFSGSDPHLAAEIAALERRFGKVDVIENQKLPVPGSIDTFDLRAANPHGAYDKPLFSLVSGHFPTSASQIAVSGPVAADFGLRVGSTWTLGGTTRQVSGIVQNPESLLDAFALVVPGQVPAPTQVLALFDGGGLAPGSIGTNVSSPTSVKQSNTLNPETISLSVLVIGMLLIALVAVGGFTVLAQRRLRSLGMLASLGATDKHVGLVVRANGVAVGVTGAVVGALAGFLAWLAYRPHLESSAHHLIGVWALPWLVVVLAVVLAVVATYFAASRPARAIVKVPIVAALSGRPAPPRQIHRSMVPGIVFLVVAFLLLGYSGGTNQGTGNAGMPELVLGLVALIPAVILLAPFCLSAMARLGRHTPVSVRLALRDLARYRARSGSALAAISLGIMIAVIIALVAAARYGNVLDWAGPNLASNQLVVYPPQPGAQGPKGQPTGPPPAPTASQLESAAKTAQSIATSVGAQRLVELDSTNASIDGTEGGRSYNGNLYVATPQLLQAFGISTSQVRANADILSMRPGFSGISGLSLTWCKGSLTPAPGPPPGSQVRANGHIFYNICSNPGTDAHPVIEELGALPAGTSDPNTVITEHAVQSLGLRTSVAGWLIQTPQPLTAVQIRNARNAAGAAGMTVESKNDEPTSSEVINWATVFGIALALGILAMSVGLIRSETAGDLRTLAATGASSFTRRTLAAATAGGLGLLGALLGTLAGYVGVLGYLRDNSLNGGISALGNVPAANLLVVLLGVPFAAVVVGWLLAGRPQHAMAHQVIE